MKENIDLVLVAESFGGPYGISYDMGRASPIG